MKSQEDISKIKSWQHNREVSGSGDVLSGKQAEQLLHAYPGTPVQGPQCIGSTPGEDMHLGCLAPTSVFLLELGQKLTRGK
ncbi:hypothetical protein P7K49_026810, partial [Saguinus oedipus]